MNNVTVNPGTGGPVIATDEIGAIHYPIHKIAHGPTGSATPVSTASPLPVELYSGPSGNQVSIAGANTGTAAFVTPSGALSTEDTCRLIGGSFTGSAVDTSIYTPTAAGTGAAITVSQGRATLASGTTTSSSAALSTVRIARFLTDYPNRAQFVVRLPDAPAAGNRRRWGMFDAGALNGAWFEVDGTTFRLRCANSGTSTLSVDSGAFNGRLGASWVPDANQHDYTIVYDASDVLFFINGGLLHAVDTTTIPWTGALSLPLSADNANTGTATSRGLEVWGGAVLRYGPEHGTPTRRNLTGTTTAQTIRNRPGSLHSIIVGKGGSGLGGSGTITVYDNTAASGTIIAAIDATASGVRDFDFKGANFDVGLTVVHSNANIDATYVFD